MRRLVTLGVILAGVSATCSMADAQTITRVNPVNGAVWTFTRNAEGVTISREGTHFSFSNSVGHANGATATASATATDPNRAFASASTSAMVRTNANGQSIDVAHARAIALGQHSSTSAVTTNGN